MSNLINSVADLINIRDKGNLEMTLARVMFEAVGASVLRLWRIVDRDGGIGFSERARLQYAQPQGTRPVMQAKPVPSEEFGLSSDLRAAYESKRHSCQPRDENGMFRHLFPVEDGAEVIALVDILRTVPVTKEQEKLIFGLLRIYRIHLGVLDYSDSDELTGLANRRPFDEAFRRIVSSIDAEASAADTRETEARPATRSSLRVQLAVADVDFFKRVNDQFGHPYGDEVLVLLSGVMKNSFRKTDRLFRFGGEEFLIILPDMSPDEADEALERFRRNVEKFAFPQVGHVTISIGVTSVRPGDAGSHAFGRADEALYMAKQQGRNQLRRYERLVADGVLASSKPVSEDIEMF